MSHLKPTTIFFFIIIISLLYCLAHNERISVSWLLDFFLQFERNFLSKILKFKRNSKENIIYVLTPTEIQSTHTSFVVFLRSLPLENPLLLILINILHNYKTNCFDKHIAFEEEEYLSLPNYCHKLCLAFSNFPYCLLCYPLQVPGECLSFESFIRKSHFTSVDQNITQGSNPEKKLLPFGHCPKVALTPLPPVLDTRGATFV